MGKYATLQDLIDRFSETEIIQRTDTTNRPATTIDQTVVDRAIADAEAMADSYIAKRYELPLADPPPVLTGVVADIARYHLHDGLATKDSPVAINQATAMRWLREVAQGLVQLESGGVAPDQAGDSEVRTAAPDRVFSRDSLGGY